MKKAVAVVALSAIVLGISYLSYGRGENHAEALQFCYPEISPIQDTVQLQGNVIAADKQYLYPQGTSCVTEIYVAEGERVKAGQCLIKLEHIEKETDRQAAVAVVLTQLQDAVTAGDLEGAAQLLQHIDADNINQTNNCKDYYLYSQCDALVMKIEADEGETVSSLLPCITLYSPESLQIEAAAGEDVIGMLASDMECYISVPAFSISDLQGSITAIAPYATEKTSITGQSACETMVRMEVCDPGFLRPGYRATAKVVVAARENALLLPYEAVGQDDSGQEYVMKLQGLRLVKQVVETGSELDDRVEICEGLQVQDAVMLYPDLRWEGALVNLANR